MTAGVVCPSIVMPTLRPPRSWSGRPASRAMPATAAAALSNTARAIGLRPRMSTTECMTSTSLSPTKGPNARRPEALGVTISLGTPTGSACIAAAPRRAPSAPPRQSTPSRRPSSQRRRQTARTPSCHQLDRRASAPRRPDALQLVAPLPGHLLPRDVGARARLTQDPRVDHDRPDSEAHQSLAHVGDLVALRVERADQRDLWLVLHRPPVMPGRATPACAPRPAPSGTPPAPRRGARRTARTSARPSRRSP